MSDSEVRYEVDGNVATHTLDAPERMNTLLPLLGTADCREGVAAFVEKRPAQFNGR